MSCPNYSGGGVLLTNIVCLCVLPSDLDTTSSPTLWWTYTVLFTGLSCVLVYLFALDDGELFPVLRRPFILQFAKLSPYLFLIHEVVLSFLSGAIRLFFPGTPISGQLLPLIRVFFGLPASILCSYLWLQIQKVLKSKGLIL